jgi:hypothetical protein
MKAATVMHLMMKIGSVINADNLVHGTKSVALRVTGGEMASAPT